MTLRKIRCERDPKALLEQLAGALSALMEKERDVIVLHDYKGYTLKAIAEMMGIPYINAKVLYTKELAYVYAENLNTTGNNKCIIF